MPVYVLALPVIITEGWPGWVDLGDQLNAEMLTVTHPSSNQACIN